MLQDYALCMFAGRYPVLDCDEHFTESAANRNHRVQAGIVTISY